jgi:mono/diheme cytochrome c family protein
MRALLVAAAGGLVAVAGTGCGAPDHAATLRRGRAIFVHSCAACHTLEGRESGAVGGDLVNAHLGVSDIASFARVMPTPAPRTQADANAVAAYIDSAASTRHKRAGRS